MPKKQPYLAISCHSHSVCVRLTDNLEAGRQFWQLQDMAVCKRMDV